MPNDTQSAAPPGVLDMAASLYVRIMGDAVTITDKTPSLAANPDVVARVSFKLAEAFYKVDTERQAAFQPKSTALDVGQINFGGGGAAAAGKKA
jgi:hypothetical protein